METINSVQQKEALNKFKSEVQQQMIQDLVIKVTDNCFKICAGQQGEGLQSTEKYCLGNCIGRYMDTMKTVNDTLQK